MPQSPPEIPLYGFAMHIEGGDFGRSVALIDNTIERNIAEPPPRFCGMHLKPFPVLVGVCVWLAIGLQSSRRDEAIMQTAQVDDAAWDELRNLFCKPLPIAVSRRRVLQKRIVLSRENSQVLERQPSLCSGGL